MEVHEAWRIEAEPITLHLKSAPQQDVVYGVRPGGTLLGVTQDGTWLQRRMQPFISYSSQLSFL